MCYGDWRRVCTTIYVTATTLLYCIKVATKQATLDSTIFAPKIVVNFERRYPHWGSKNTWVRHICNLSSVDESSATVGMADCG